MNFLTEIEGMIMSTVEQYVVNSNIFLAEAVELMGRNKHKGLIIVEDEKVIGVFTRQDLVRCVHFFGMQSIVLKKFINRKFLYCIDEIDQEIIENTNKSLIPILNQDQTLKDIYFPEKKSKKNNYEYPVVIMAGGLGTRLYPYTKILPKPLVPVNGTPMVELIINRFHEIGTDKFYLIVNHKKEMIEAYFDNLEKEYQVKYAEETQQLGTGGGLYFVKEMINQTFFLTNCDILLLEDYDEIFEFHKKSGNKVTMIVSVKSMKVPYGVMDVDANQTIKAFHEKPTYGMLVNTGIYVVEPEVFGYIELEEKIDFPSLLQRMIANEEKIGVYPITEDKWIDMGQVEEYKQACNVIKDL